MVAAGRFYKKSLKRCQPRFHGEGRRSATSQGTSVPWTISEYRSHAAWMQQYQDIQDHVAKLNSMLSSAGTALVWPRGRNRAQNNVMRLSGRLGITALDSLHVTQVRAANEILACSTRVDGNLLVHLACVWVPGIGRGEIGDGDCCYHHDRSNAHHLTTRLQPQTNEGEHEAWRTPLDQAYIVTTRDNCSHDWAAVSDACWMMSLVVVGTSDPALTFSNMMRS